MAHGAMPTKPACPAMFFHYLNTFNMGAMDSVSKFPDEMNHRDILPFHVRAIEVEPNHALITCFIHGLEVIVCGFEIAHGSFAWVALEVEGDTVFLASV